MNKTVVYILWLLLIGTTSFADNGAAGNIKIKKIYIAEEGLWPPYTFEKEGIPTKGIAWEVMNAVFERLGIEIDMRLLPQKRMLQYLRGGRKDVVSVISKNRDRLTFLEYSVPLFQDTGVICYSAKRKKAFRWEKFSDLHPYRIGLIRGHNYGNDFPDAIIKHHLNVQYVTNYEQNFKKLDAGRVDIVLINRSSTSEFLRQYPDYTSRIKISEKPFYTYDYYIAFSKKSPARVLIPEVNKVITRLKAEGVIDTILKKYNMK